VIMASSSLLCLVRRGYDSLSPGLLFVFFILLGIMTLGDGQEKTLNMQLMNEWID
jgi:hypothetical protein